MNTLARIWPTLCALHAVIASTPAVCAQPTSTDRIIVTVELKRVHAGNLEIGPGVVSYQDSEGRARAMPRDAVLAVMSPETTNARIDTRRRTWRESAEPRSVVTGRVFTTDGRVLPGKIVNPDQQAAPDHLIWEHGLLGRFDIPLDQVAVLVLRGEQQQSEATVTPTSDVIELVNGDRIEGFVSTVGGEVRMESGGKRASFPVERVASVRFANTPIQPAGSRVWLSDGSTVEGASVVSESGGALSITLPGDGGTGPRVSIPFGDVSAINFDAKRLRPLSDCRLTVVSLPKERVWSPPPRLTAASPASAGSADIELPGPMTVEWALPAGVGRVAGVVELPSSSRAWGDCTLTMDAGGKEVFRARLNGSRPEAEFSFDVGGSTRVRATLDPGESGSVQDRLIIRRALVRVDGSK